MISMNPSSYGGGGPLAVGVGSALFALSTILLALRVYTNVRLVKRASWDLVWIFVAYLLGLVAQIFLALCTHYGITNHLKDVDPDYLALAFLFQWIFNICTILSTGFGKLAIIDILLCIEGPTIKSRRYVLYFVGASTMALNVNQSILVWFQCKPVHKLWDPLAPGTCGAQHTILSIGVLQGSWSAACDFFLALYPIFIFWQLQISWKRKIGLSALFAGGSVAGSAAAIKTSYILTLQASNDITYAILPLVLWAEVEMWLIIIMSSIPSLKPLFVTMFRSVRDLSLKKSRMNRASCRPDTGASASKEYPGSVKLQSICASRLDGVNRTTRSESVENILPKGDNIMITRDFEVA